MITAVEAWARQKPKPDWNHPLPAIKNALLEKAGGRVLQTDTSLRRPSRRRGGRLAVVPGPGDRNASLFRPYD